MFSNCVLQHIPKYISPRNRNWKAGENVTLTIVKGSWNISVVLSKGTGRFSTGWNRFSVDNNLIKSNTLIFTMFETAEGINFNVEKEYL